jgi:hypothetical protein
MCVNRLQQKRFLCGSIAACSLVLLSSGCLSYRTGELPDAELSRQNFMARSKQSALITVACQTRSINENVLGKNVSKAQELRGVFAKVLGEIEPLKAYTFSASRGTNANLRIVTSLIAESRGSIVNVCFSLATLTIIPTTEATTFSLKTQVYDSAGKMRGDYEVKDSMRSWIQILFITLGPWKAPEKVEQQLLENLIRTTLLRMKDDGMLSGPQI